MNSQVNYYDNMRNIQIKRGELFYADLGEGIGSEQKYIRPVVIIQNNRGNLHSPTVIIAAITSQQSKAKLPTHIEIKSYNSGLKEDSIILLEQIRTIDKSRLKSYIGRCPYDILQRVNEALTISIDTKEIFDLDKVNTLTRSINELEKFIIKYGEAIDLTDVYDSIDNQKKELINYCTKFNKNYRMFFRSKFEECTVGIEGANKYGRLACIG